MGGASVQYLLIDNADNVIRLKTKTFDELWKEPREHTLPQFAGQRLRAAELVVLLHNGRRVKILRELYRYLYFDAYGGLDKTKMFKDAALIISASDYFDESLSAHRRSDSVIDATRIFAVRRRDHEAVWRPGLKLRELIRDAAFGVVKCRTL
jgi:hypothetical protein